MLAHVLDTAAALTSTVPTVVIGHGAEQVRAAFADAAIRWVEQREQLGTGHAVAQALATLPEDALVLILYGDVPLLSSATLRRLQDAALPSGFALLTAELAQPAGYGRILRDAEGGITRIVEHKDASDAERKIIEVNTGIMAIHGRHLHAWLPALRNDNAQGEYYLTDLVAMARAEGVMVVGVPAASVAEITGVNDRAQLAALERTFQQALAARLMDEGLSLADPARLDIRGSLSFGTDCFVDINCVFEGAVVIGNNVRIGPHCMVRNTSLADGVSLLPYSMVDGAVIGEGAQIGPFARVRPETRLAADVHIGNFVEVKKSTLGKGSKANHLAYLGDSEIGERVNIGAGTITCNYDGAAKHKTIIEDDVFIGSDSQLVAPVTVGRGTTVGAGTTVTEDVPPERLVISRVRQKTVAGWQRPRKPSKP